MVRTGIDLGTGSVKLVRGEGSSRLEWITHADAEYWGPVEREDDVSRAAGALKRLLHRLHLGRNSLGRVAVSVSGEHSSLREVLMPPMSEEEIRQALPFEARRHLGLEDMPNPILGFQILGKASPSEEGGAEQIKVLLAAVAGGQRSFPLQVLSRLDLEPEVVDLEPLAGLNTLLAALAPATPEGRAYGLLDLGTRTASLHLTQADGAVLTRPVGEGIGRAKDMPSSPAFLEELVGKVRETMTFYRGRFRCGVGSIFLGGGGALLPGLAGQLMGALDVPVRVLNPLENLEAKSGLSQEQLASGPRFVIACGLCRWWDGLDV
jgi:Tfp pilus assembly PilM family ATPase